MPMLLFMIVSTEQVCFALCMCVCESGGELVFSLCQPAQGRDGF